jgi:hypothetical protein
MLRSLTRRNQFVRRYSTPVQSEGKKKLYELRTYNVKPKAMSQFIRLTNEWIHLRTQASPLIGYWTTELGGINQVVHMWEYESLSQRQAVRVGLSTNQEWIENYFSIATKMWDSQTNAVMTPILELQTPAGSGVYELRKSFLQATSPYRKADGKLLERQPRTDGGFLVGAWETVVGDMPGFYELWQYPSLDHVLDKSARRASQFFAEMKRDSKNAKQNAERNEQLKEKMKDTEGNVDKKGELKGEEKSFVELNSFPF